MNKKELKFLEKCKNYQISLSRDEPDSHYCIIDENGIGTNAWYMCKRLLAILLKIERASIDNIDDFIPLTTFDVGVEIIKKRLRARIL